MRAQRSRAAVAAVIQVRERAGSSIRPAPRSALTWMRSDASTSRRYTERSAHGCRYRIPAAPIGVSFSGGIGSGAILLRLYKLLLNEGQSPARLKAFTLSIDGKVDDAR